jgi:hypothetical protein
VKQVASAVRVKAAARARMAFGAVLAAALACAGPPVAAGDVAYDPDKCISDSQGQVYITLYGAVFAFPVRQPLYVGAVPPEHDKLVPPPLDPAEPTGCPGHPREASLFTSPHHYPYLKARLNEPWTGRLKLLNFTAAPPGALQQQREAEADFDRFCAETGVVRNEPAGFDQCYSESRLDKSGRGPRDLIYRAHGGYYKSPFGRPFQIVCVHYGSVHLSGCTVIYKIYETVYLQYKFSTPSIPLENIVDLDKTIRARLTEAHRPDLSQPFPAGASVDLDLTGFPKRYDQVRCRRATELAAKNIPLPYIPSDAAEDVYLRVKGVRFAIPANYFRYPPIGCDTEERGFLLRVLLPDYEGFSPENEVAMTEGGLDRMQMNILLQPGPRPDLVTTFGALARGVDPDGKYPTWQGLYQSENQYNDDIYFERDEGRVTFLMTCSRLETANFPICKQYFSYQGSVIGQHFGRTLLDNWREIRDGTIRLLDRFVASAARNYETGEN